MFDLTCARCGKAMEHKARSRPQGEAMCHPCRRELNPKPAPKPRAYRPTKTCATCAKPIHKGRGGLPQGQAQCRNCRRLPPNTCVDCGCEVSRDVTRCQSCHRANYKLTAKTRTVGRTRRIVIDGRVHTDPRQTRDWKLLRDQVVYEEPLCAIRLGGCTGWSETADHIEQVVDRPDLAFARSNLRGACHSCNMRVRHRVAATVI